MGVREPHATGVTAWPGRTRPCCLWQLYSDSLSTKHTRGRCSCSNMQIVSLWRLWRLSAAHGHRTDLLQMAFQWRREFIQNIAGLHEPTQLNRASSFCSKWFMIIFISQMFSSISEFLLMVICKLWQDFILRCDISQDVWEHWLQYGLHQFIYQVIDVFWVDICILLDIRY